MTIESRREFVQSVAVGASAMGTFMNQALGQPTRKSRIETVTGAIRPKQLGRTLVHEHIMVDFIGADQVSPSRYDAEEVFQVMLPYLKTLRAQGVKSFIDCTPSFLGRDVKILRRLSKATGLQMVTNTGLYKEPYLPAYAFEQSIDELARQWIREMEEGIEGTGIRAGFIKIAVHREDLKPMQQKIVRTACRTHRATGAAIACHSGHGPAMMQILDILREEKTPAGAFIAVHAGSEKDMGYHQRLAQAGAWLEYDHIGSNPAGEPIRLIKTMLEKDFGDRLLLSMDRGWYRIGEPRGGKVKPYDYFYGEFVPEMKKAGISDAVIRQLTVENPAKAFTLI